MPAPDLLQRDFTAEPFAERTRSEMRTILCDYIETFCNRTRHQAALGHRTPAEVKAADLTG